MIAALALGPGVAGTPLPPSGGGTGQTSYTDGQLLIGNTATGGLNKSTLTAGANITITNGNGTITIAAAGGGGAAGANPTGTIGLTAVNGAAVTFLRSDGAPALSQAIAPTWTAAHIFSQSALAATRTPGLTLTNTTAAAAGAQQNSPSIRMTGQGWKTTATAASQTVDFDTRVVPVQGAANPSANLTIASQINGAGFTDVVTVSETGLLTAVGVNATGAIGAGTNVGAGATGFLFWSGRTLMSSPGDTKVRYANNVNLAGVTITYGSNIVTIRDFTDSTNAALTVGVFIASTIFGTTGTFTSTLATSNGQNIGWSGASLMRSGTDGNIIFSNNAQTSFSLLQFGGTTSSFPAIKRSSATLAFRLADDSADASITAAGATFSAPVKMPGYTVATLPAGAVGQRAYVTDALTPIYNGALTGGSSGVVPVFFDGSSWKSA